MSAVEHDRGSLGAYALGALDPDETRTMDEHIAQCADCRREVAELTELRGLLGAVPPEAFLDGPPDNGELLLQRTVRRLRTQQRGQPRRARFPVTAGVAMIALAALGVGVLLGRQTAPGGEAPGPQGGVVQAAPGTRTGQATNQASGVSMNVNLTPAAGWVRVHAVVRGVPAGKRCQLLVVSQGGDAVLGGGWLESGKDAHNGTSLDGTALIDPKQVRSVDVVTTDGERLVSVSV